MGSVKAMDWRLSKKSIMPIALSVFLIGSVEAGPKLYQGSNPVNPVTFKELYHSNNDYALAFGKDTRASETGPCYPLNGTDFLYEGDWGVVRIFCNAEGRKTDRLPQSDFGERILFADTYRFYSSEQGEELSIYRNKWINNVPPLAGSGAVSVATSLKDFRESHDKAKDIKEINHMISQAMPLQAGWHQPISSDDTFKFTRRLISDGDDRLRKAESFAEQHLKKEKPWRIHQSLRLIRYQVPSSMRSNSSIPSFTVEKNGSEVVYIVVYHPPSDRSKIITLRKKP